MAKEFFTKPFLAFLEEGKEKYLPHLSIDCVVFAFQDGKLKVLLSQFGKNGLAVLAGGFIGKEEDIDEAANRILEERTGLTDIFLQQFQAFGLAERRFELEILPELQKFGIPEDSAEWMMKRFITIGYYALVRAEETNPVPGPLTQTLIWSDIDDLPIMAMDHANIIDSARKLLAKEIGYQPVAQRLMPKNFTIPELQTLYETILGRSIDRGNFRKKVLKASILEKLDKQKTGGAHRAPQLYRFHPDHSDESFHGQMKMGF
ncbi:MAG: NUDIX domain-containing protein [Bacteroidota bacterium]